jgi:hypothetical protein
MIKQFFIVKTWFSFGFMDGIPFNTFKFNYSLTNPVSKDDLDVLRRFRMRNICWAFGDATDDPCWQCGGPAMA